ncbi:hypothetical protein NOM01_10970 [Sporolactobacillus sp. STSJ-5]|uniref:hypothetical protein n=1 Tax=Sporolactobacillus sp. STSJ-5 TaxID=2965076 RepID=UPI00210481A8|nr:hypothetical protein [Sporolactobacillus sp. STSJ-5]MCQ2010537.1 hypothetical protein [Sporolactobacillus sp. STSJ-5]
MKLLGMTLTFQGFDIWHKGNLTKLSQLQNDLGLGLTITVSTTAPSSTTAGQLWYKVVS